MAVISLFLISGLLFYSGYSAVQTKQISFHPKRGGTQHVTGDRAVSHGRFQLLLGCLMLGVAGYQLVKLMNSGSPPPPADNSSESKDQSDQGSSPPQ